MTLKPTLLSLIVATTATSAAAEGVGAVAVLAAQRAAGEPYKYGGQASSARFTLQRVKDFGNT